MGLYDRGGMMPGSMPGVANTPQQLPNLALPEDPHAATRPQEAGFFSKGRGLRDFIGYGLGAVAQQFGGANPYQQQMDDDNEMRREIVKAKLLAQLKGERNDDTPAMREAVAMGMPPGSPEFNEYVRRARMKPSFMMMGNPETGQQIVNPEEMGGPIQPGTVEDGHVFLGGDPGDPNSWRPQ